MKPVLLQINEDLVINIHEVQALVKVNGGTQITFFKGSFETAWGMDVVEVMDLIASVAAHG